MIKFGTDGWRGIISKDFTFANVHLVAQALADYINSLDNAGAGVVVGFDTRFLSGEYAAEVARVLSGNRVPVFLADRPTPTPAVSFAVKQKKAAGGIMVTASHNPPVYNGIKLKGSFGGSAFPQQTGAVEKLLGANPVITGDSNGPLVSRFNPLPQYFAHLETLIDLDLIRGSGIKVIADPMYGAGAGCFRELLGECCREIHNEINPSFGNLNPEPIAKNLDALAGAVPDSDALIGLALDGDADRIGAVDSKGRFIDAHRIFALLLKYLAENKGWRGGVVKTFSTTEMIDKLAYKFGLPLFETPIGFKYICELFLKDDILIGGEESGGLGFKNHLPERDGILAGLFLLEMVALSGHPPEELIAGLMQELGPHYYRRLDLKLAPEQRDKLVQMISTGACPELAALNISDFRDLDGFKYLYGRGWLLFRFSGTEPLLRIYAEGDAPEFVELLLDTARTILNKI
ncbi:MAG: phosphoglucomutase/phosphomannomutase family protein [Bacillota bacterium]